MQGSEKLVAGFRDWPCGILVGFGGKNPTEAWRNLV